MKTCAADTLQPQSEVVYTEQDRLKTKDLLGSLSKEPEEEFLEWPESALISLDTNAVVATKDLPEPNLDQQQGLGQSATEQSELLTDSNPVDVTNQTAVVGNPVEAAKANHQRIQLENERHAEEKPQLTENLRSEPTRNSTDEAEIQEPPKEELATLSGGVEFASDTKIEGRSPLESFSVNPPTDVPAPEPISSLPQVVEPVHAIATVEVPSAFETELPIEVIEVKPTFQESLSTNLASQVQDVVKRVVLETNSDQKSMRVEIRPRDLGFMTIQVDQSSEKMVAEIVATEIVTVEMLVHEKNYLLEALSDLGFADAQLDIRYGNEQQSQSSNTNQPFGQTQDSSKEVEPSTVPPQTPSDRGVDLLV